MSANNAEWLSRFENIMPWGSGTCSKAITYWPEEPSVIVKGRGCRVWDADGREFIDFRNGLGPVTLGYAFPEVNEAIAAQLESGVLFGHPTPLECEAAETVCRLVPCAQKARFLKTGGEAIAACVKIARAFTGRDHIVHVGYNGWLSNLAGAKRTSPGQAAPERDETYPIGVPAVIGRLSHTCGWNDAGTMTTLFDEYDNQIAAVVIACDYAEAELGSEFYPFVRKLTNERGALMICDEIVMGMRIAIGGAHDFFGFQPDLAVLSKGIANGMPLAVYAGRGDIMEACGRTGGAVVSSTFAGEALSLAAAKACLSIYERDNVVGFLWRQGKRMWEGLQGIFDDKGIDIRIAGFYPAIAFAFNDAKLADPFFRAAYRNGVSLYQSSYVNFSHRNEDIDEALERLNAACRVFVK